MLPVTQKFEQLLKDWSFDFGEHYAPRSLEGVGSEDFMDVLSAAHHMSDLNYHVDLAFVAEYHQELREENPTPLDDPDLDVD